MSLFGRRVECPDCKAVVHPALTRIVPTPVALFRECPRCKIGSLLAAWRPITQELGPKVGQGVARAKQEGRE